MFYSIHSKKNDIRLPLGSGQSYNFTFIGHLDVVLDVIEGGQVELLEILGVLYGDDVLPGERFVRDQLLPVLRLYVQLLHRLNGTAGNERRSSTHWDIVK